MTRTRITHAELKRRLDRLAGSLLPPDSTSPYTDSEKDRIHGYVVLAHAEIELYLENLGFYVVDQARRKSRVGPCAPVISRLIVYKTSQSNELEEATQENISGACGFYEKLLDRNHGLRQPHLFRIFLPLGLNHADFDPVLIGDLNTFGTDRGEIAHTAARLKQGSSPSKERKRVDNILTNLAHFDQRVRALL